MIDIAIFIILVILCIILLIIAKSNGTHTNNDKVNFDEFDDVETIREQEKRRKQEMEYESGVLGQVYEDALDKRITNDITVSDIRRAKKEVEKTKKELNDFKILDSVKIDSDEKAEGVPIAEFKENGNKMNTDLFKKWSRQIFGCIKLGNEQQLQVVKKFITDELYDRLIYQKRQFEKDGLEFITEDLLIEKVSIFDYSKGMNREEIQVLINTKMKEYIIDKQTNKVVRGNKNSSYTKKVVMTFLKKNIDEEEGLTKNCSNCGAEIEQTEFGKCRYCGTLIFPIRYNWTLIKFETM